MVLLAIALVLGMMVVGCNNEDENENGGTFTLTDIPSKYNGKYAVLDAYNGDVDLRGCQNINLSTKTLTASKISGGKVSIPMWILRGNYVERYSGNDTIYGGQLVVVIINSATNVDDELAGLEFDSVTFSNGNATKSWKDAYVDE